MRNISPTKVNFQTPQRFEMNTSTPIKIAPQIHMNLSPQMGSPSISTLVNEQKNVCVGNVPINENPFA